MDDICGAIQQTTADILKIEISFPSLNHYHTFITSFLKKILKLKQFFRIISLHYLEI